MDVTGKAQKRTISGRKRNMPGCCHSRRTRHGKKRMENKIKAVKPFLLPSFQCHFIRSTGRGGGEGKGARDPSNQNTMDANTFKMCNCQQKFSEGQLTPSVPGQSRMCSQQHYDFVFLTS